MHRSDKFETLQDCKCRTELCICGSILYGNPGSILVFKGGYSLFTSPCIKRWGFEYVTSLNFQYLSEIVKDDEPQTFANWDTLMDSDFIVWMLEEGLELLHQRGSLSTRQVFFMRHLVKMAIPPYVDGYVRGKQVGYELASARTYMTVQEYIDIHGCLPKSDEGVEIHSGKESKG